MIWSPTNPTKARSQHQTTITAMLLLYIPTYVSQVAAHFHVCLDSYYSVYEVTDGGFGHMVQLQSWSSMSTKLKMGFSTSKMAAVERSSKFWNMDWHTFNLKAEKICTISTVCIKFDICYHTYAWVVSLWDAAFWPWLSPMWTHK